jgi:hypothetical protein
MSLSLNKILLAGATSNTPGAYPQFVNVTCTSTTIGNVIPAGIYTVFPTANVTIQAVSAVNANGNVTAISIVLANNTGGVVFSDGVNFFANTTVANTVVQLIGTNSGLNVSGTYNNV